MNGSTRLYQVDQRLVISALGQLGDIRDAESLIPKLEDIDQRTREAAVRALERIGWQPADDTQRARLAIAQDDWKRVLSLGAAAVEPLVASLRNVGTESFALDMLAIVGDERAVRALMTYANGSSKAPRYIEALQSVLARSIERVTQEDLLALSTLTDVVLSWYYRGDCWNAPSWRETPVDCARVRQLARQELIRRGGEA